MDGTTNDERWQVFWCQNAWWDYAASLERALPPWAYLKRVDPAWPLAEQVRDADVLIPTTALVGPAVIAAAVKLKLVAQPAAAYHNIAVADCAARDIPVCRTVELNSVSTAEAALCCILMLAKRANEQQQSFRERVVGQPQAWQLQGKTLGIVGLGSIGRHLARVAQALGMRVLGTTSASSRGELEALLRGSDVVSIHCPLNGRTRGLLGAAELALMRPGALLVNYARGDVLDEQAVTEAVLSGRLGGLGLDVHWSEPEDPSKPLYSHPNVVCFPHSGASTDAVLEGSAAFIVSNMLAVREGRPDLVGQLPPGTL